MVDSRILDLEKTLEQKLEEAEKFYESEVRLDVDDVEFILRKLKEM